MPHIHTGHGQHDTTASAYIVLNIAGDEPKMLLHMHKKLGVLLQFGGHVELRETVWQAIAHEIEEESGYALSELDVLQPPLRIRNLSKGILHPQPVLINTHTFKPVPGHCHLDTAFLLQARDLPYDAPDEGESNDIRALNRQEIAALPDSMIYADTRELSLELLDNFIDAWEPVPASDFSLELPRD